MGHNSDALLFIDQAISINPANSDFFRVRGDMESGKIQMVNEDMHRRFTHHGGHSYYKNRAGGS